MATEPIPKTRAFLEVYKFKNLDTGEIAVRVTNEGGTVDVTTGLDLGGKFTLVELTASEWRPLPATNHTGRNGLIVQNETGADVYINHSLAAPADEGVLLRDGSERIYNTKNDTVVLYGRMVTGAPDSEVGCEEIA